MQHLVVSKSLVLIEIPVPKPAKAAKQASAGMNHIWEIDRSGSMSWLLPSLVKDLKQKVRELLAGDTISLGWFSGTGDKSFVLKGYPINGDFGALDRALDSFATSRGMTCFSEILVDTKQVIEETAAIHSGKFALCFFTDGYPTVGNYGTEVERINQAIDAIKGSLTASLVVGYGDFYNKELLSKMSERLTGSLIHSSDLPSFSVAFKTFQEDARESAGTTADVSYEGVLGAQMLFTLNGKQINVLPVEKAASVRVPLTNRAKDTLYVLAAAAPMTSKEVKLTDKAFVGRTASQEELIKGAYAAACLLTQRTKTDQALEVLGTLGDVAMVDAVTNAFTAAEYGKAEDSLRGAMAGPSKRLTKGRDTSYLPPENAFCLLDLLDTLREAYFMPAHSAFEYKRVGLKQENKPGFGKFKMLPGATTPLNAFTWNESRLNLSVLARIQGTVDLQDRDGKKPADYGLLTDYPTSVYRNFTIVKDGALNITRLPVTNVTPAAEKVLRANNLVFAEETAITNDGMVLPTTFIVDLTKVPIVNRAIANGKTSAKDLCKLVSDDLDFRGELKALKWYRDAVEEAEEKAATLAKAEITSVDFLLKNGVDVAKGTYSPEKLAVKSEDYYDAKTFDITIKGASSLPKVQDVLDKLKMNKPLKVSEEGIATGIKTYQASGVENQGSQVALVWLKDRIEKVSVAQRKNRRIIQETKFSVILGKKWFEEFSSREEGTLEFNGRTFKFELGSEKVNF